MERIKFVLTRRPSIEASAITCVLPQTTRDITPLGIEMMFETSIVLDLRTINSVRA